MGHLVTSNGTSPDPEKIRAVEDWPRPETERELRGFLGLSGYYRRFVPGYASIAAPLHKLLTKPTEVKNSKKKVKKRSTKEWSYNRNIRACWDQSCEESFNSLKHALTSAPVLGYPDFTQPFILETDASFQGLGAILSQKQDDKIVVLEILKF